MTDINVNNSLKASMCITLHANLFFTCVNDMSLPREMCAVVVVVVSTTGTPSTSLKYIHVSAVIGTLLMLNDV
jgi:hypothetical protein